MQPHNTFSINLNQQKSKAKKRLRAIRQGDESSLTLIKKFHPHAEILNPATIQLADVQFALARELGLSSWSKLKAHTKNLTLHKLAIKNKEQALDSELSTLHVRCGHDIQERLKLCGFKGEFLPMIDPLCIGPVPTNEDELINIRSNYIAKTLLPIMGQKASVQNVIQNERDNLDTLLSSKFKRIVFWVEHDSYDQLMLLRGLTLLTRETAKIIEIIELNQFPGTERFIGFGQLPAEAIRSCWQHRKPIHAKLMSQAKVCWNALLSKNPHSIVELLTYNSLDCLPNISTVFKRHLKELPHSKSGLNLTQYLALSVLREYNESISVKTWFKLYQQQEPLPFLGDVMFYALLLPLTISDSPLFIITSSDKNWLNQNVALTPRGSACLAGEITITQDYWVGGIHINEKSHWSWDHLNLSSFEHTT